MRAVPQIGSVSSDREALLNEGPAETVRRVGEIGDRLAALWRQSGEEGVPVHRLASKLAEEKLAPAHERSRG